MESLNLLDMGAELPEVIRHLYKMIDDIRGQVITHEIQLDPKLLAEAVTKHTLKRNARGSTSVLSGDNVLVSLRVAPALLARIDEARGDVPRNTWITKQLEKTFNAVGTRVTTKNGIENHD